MHKHYRSLNGWSFNYWDYFQLNITQYLNHPNMLRLAEIVDPYGNKLTIKAFKIKYVFRSIFSRPVKIAAPFDLWRPGPGRRAVPGGTRACMFLQAGQASLLTLPPPGGSTDGMWGQLNEYSLPARDARWQ